MLLANGRAEVAVGTLLFCRLFCPSYNSLLFPNSIECIISKSHGYLPLGLQWGEFALSYSWRTGRSSWTPTSGRQVWLCFGVPGLTACSVTLLSYSCTGSCTRGTPFRSSQALSQWEIDPAQLLPFVKNGLHMLSFVSLSKRSRKIFRLKAQVFQKPQAYASMFPRKNISLISVAEWSFPVILWWSADTLLLVRNDPEG